MQLYASSDPNTLVRRLLIERMRERVVRGDRPVRPVGESDWLQEMVPRQRLTLGFELDRGRLEARRHGRHGKGDPGHTGHLQGLLQRCRQALNLLLQQGANALWHAEHRLLEGPLEAPVPGVLGEDATLDQGGHHGHQKERIAVSVREEPWHQGRWQAMRGKAGGEIGGHGLGM
jgi:hypothetical protein